VRAALSHADDLIVALGLINLVTVVAVVEAVTRGGSIR